MAKIAFNCLELQSDGRWLCVKTETVPGRYGPVGVRVGQSFAPGTVFAGFDDFAAHLASVSVEVPSKAPHEW